ncbi:MAG: CinA family nicotinamide mononucleotide deamidase-related protein [Pirellulales bacterium]|nr:CinA family nicotinamide mononucleotide deamidase-related protein [Pirellulales bacterium]
MHAEIISIGDEMTSGQRLDTNSQWLSLRLGELGVSVKFHTTVADDLAANVQVFRLAAERADLIVATGGLGPTADDLTRDAIAAVAGVELELDEGSMGHIERLFARRKRPMPERNRIQAMFPRGSRVIPNPAGTAPGIDMEISRPGRMPARIFALPGVPAEMKEMWTQTVAAELSKLLGTPHIIRHRQIKCFGVGESDLEQMLPDIIRRGRDPQVGITVHGATITLRITAEGDTADECFRRMEPTIATIRECLGDLVFGEGDDELEHAVVRLLKQQQKTLATAEWGSGGMIAHWLTEAPDSRDFYLGGLVANSGAFPEPHFDGRAAIDPNLSPDAKLAAAAAKACQEEYHADYGLSVGQLPIVNGTDAAVPLLWFALATPDNLLVKSSPYTGHPDILKLRGGKQALNLLRLTLLCGQRSKPAPIRESTG